MSIRVRTTIIFAFLFALAESFSSAFGTEPDKASVSFRIGTSVRMDDARFAQARDQFDKYSGAQVGKTIVGLFENALGGRVCLSGYFPQSNFLGRPKQAQIRSVARWLPRDQRELRRRERFCD